MTTSLDDRLERLVRADPDLMSILLAIRDLPDARLVAGCLYQSVWNALTGRPRGFGIKDYDVAYFDGGDLSWDAEDRVIVRVRGDLPPALALRVEVRNQARVHLWYEDHFGVPFAPLASTDEAINRYASTTHMVGVRLTPEGDMSIYAPGLQDIFALRVRPNRPSNSRATYEAKAQRMQATWPELTVQPW